MISNRKKVREIPVDKKKQKTNKQKKPKKKTIKEHNCKNDLKCFNRASCFLLFYCQTRQQIETFLTEIQV